MKLFGERRERVKILRPFASVDVTGNLGDVLEVPATRARELIAAGWAEAAPDAPVENAPTPFREVECRACFGLNSEYAGRCQHCGARLL